MKYQETSLIEHPTEPNLRAGLTKWFDLYNNWRTTIDLAMIRPQIPKNLNLETISIYRNKTSLSAEIVQSLVVSTSSLVLDEVFRSLFYVLIATTGKVSYDDLLFVHSGSNLIDIRHRMRTL